MDRDVRRQAVELIRRLRVETEKLKREVEAARETFRRLNQHQRMRREDPGEDPPQGDVN